MLSRAAEIYVAFTENSFDFFVRASLGIGRCVHEDFDERKSFSVSRTFSVITKVEEFEAKIRELAAMISEDMRSEKKKAKHFTLIAKTHNFDVKNHGTPVDKYTSDESDIINTCIKMLHEILPLDPLRLMGIKAS